MTRARFRIYVWTAWFTSLLSGMAMVFLRGYTGDLTATLVVLAIAILAMVASMFVLREFPSAFNMSLNMSLSGLLIGASAMLFFIYARGGESQFLTLGLKWFVIGAIFSILFWSGQQYLVETLAVAEP